MEWLLLYMWMVKDLAWALSWYFIGIGFGTLAVLWSIYLLFLSLKANHYIEAWHFAAVLFWLAGNFWWMWGDLHDAQYPSEEKIYNSSKFQGVVILSIAFGSMIFYYTIVRPCKLLPAPPDEVEQYYSQSEVKPPARLQLLFLFPTWRQYEHISIFLFLGNNISYCLFWPVLWCISTSLTLLVAADFAATTSFYRGMAVDHVHTIAVLLWAIATAAWTGDELLIRHSDSEPAVTLFSGGPAEYKSGRWYCACIIIFALAMIGVLHAVWLVLSDRIRARHPARRE
jgi:hypothetical protein